jgi:hypothetical protein
VRFDPRLKMSPETRYQLEIAEFGPDLPTVLFTSAYSIPLTFEASDGDVFVRAATGEEVTDALTTDLVEEGDDLDCPGDPPEHSEIGLTWQERPDSDIGEDDAVLLWSGEVILRSGQGISGPFYVHQLAAEAWTFFTALGLPEGEVFECQLVPYRCARRFAPALLRDGEPEYERLRRFWEAPVRAIGEPLPVVLPGSDAMG